MDCFRCWEIRSYGDLENRFEKTPKLLISKTPSSESKKVELSYRQGVSYE